MKTISEQALIKRVNRRLAKNAEQLHKYSGSRWQSDLGTFYVSDERNHIVGSHIDLNDFAADLGIRARC